MVILICFLVFIIMCILSYFAINTYAVSSQSMALRFKVVGNLIHRQGDAEQDQVKVPVQSFGERILQPLGQRFSAVYKGLTPAGLTQTVELRLMRAGGMAGLKADQFIGIVGIVTTLGLIVAVLSSILFRVALIKGIGVALFVGMFLPNFMLSKKIATRQASIQKDLPDVLDLVTVSVAAGLSFDGALAKLSEKMKGTLVDEFTRVLQEMRMGVTRKDALKMMSTRCGNDDLSLFISSLIQADQLGVGIGGVLKVQSDGIRLNRRQQIEKKANKAPIFMLIPLVICIFPTLFIVLMGPALLKVSTELFK